MVKKHRFPLAVVTLMLLVVPLVAACGGSTTETPTAAPQPAGQAAPGATTAAGQAAPALPVADVTVTIPFQQGGITSFDHAYWTSQLFVSQGVIFEGLYGYDPNLNVVP